MRPHLNLAIYALVRLQTRLLATTPKVDRQYLYQSSQRPRLPMAHQGLRRIIIIVAYKCLWTIFLPRASLRRAPAMARGAPLTRPRSIRPGLRRGGHGFARRTGKDQPFSSVSTERPRRASRRALRARTGRERGARAIRGQDQRRLVAGSDQDPEAEARIDSRRPQPVEPPLKSHSIQRRRRMPQEQARVLDARGSRRRALPDSQGACPMDILDGRSRQLVSAPQPSCSHKGAGKTPRG